MILRVLLLLRLVVFMAVIYLGLHILVARYSRKPGSRLLWFFDVVTAPLLKVAAPFTDSAASPARRRLTALAVFVALWFAAIVVVEMLAPRGA